MANPVALGHNGVLSLSSNTNFSDFTTNQDDYIDTLGDPNNPFGGHRIDAAGGNDTIFGFALDLNGKANTVDGGAGIDTLLIPDVGGQNPAAQVVNLNNAITDLANGDSIIANVEIIDVSRVTGQGLVLNFSLQTEPDGFTIKLPTVATNNNNHNITGSNQNDTIVEFGKAGSTINGGGGVDTLKVPAGIPGTPNDNQIVSIETIDASGARAGVAIDLSNQTEGFGVALDGVVITRGVIGGNFDDTITGGRGDDVIEGGRGNDQIDGGPGSDTIIGGAGDDTIQGNLGNDVIVGFTAGDVVDGGGGIDTIQVVTAADAAALSNASNIEVVNVEIIDASKATVGVNIDLRKQAENFTIVGSGQNDTIAGSGGVNLINAEDGDDVIQGLNGQDTVDGGAGTDTIKAVTAADVAFLNSATNDQIKNVEVIDASGAAAGVNINFKTTQTEGFKFILSPFNDTITGGSGDDTFVGFGANDFVDGGGGTNVIEILVPGDAAGLNAATDDQLKNVQLIDASKATVGIGISLTAQTENFTIKGGDGDDSITGGAGADTITGGAGNDVINGGAGNDTIDGGPGEDLLVGGVGNDKISGGDDKDIILGEDGNDTIDGGAGDDIIIGGVGNDSISGGAGNDIIYNSGEDGNDTIDGGAGDDTVQGGPGNDSIAGGDGKDLILGEGGNDTIAGGAGDDTILGGPGDDSIAGGDGKDIIIGGAGKDTILGGADDDVLYGDGDDDSIEGGDGNDVIVGGAGTDTLVGGAGADYFVFATGAPFSLAIGNDKIDDFSPTEDFILLSKATFTAFTTYVFSGGTTIKAEDFEVIATGGATAAGASSALIVYETSTGALYYNPDRDAAGLGGGGQFATIAGAPTISANNIVIVG